MKKITIEESQQQVTNAEISEFETKYNIILPENYKKLIKKYNGGYDASDEHILNSIYSLKYGDNTIEDARKTLQIIEENIPLKFLPIGSTGTGNFITLFIDSTSADNNKIFLFRHDDLEPILLTNSLEELLSVESIDDLA